jgi:hypothetical protein
VIVGASQVALSGEKIKLVSRDGIIGGVAVEFKAREGGLAAGLPVDLDTICSPLRGELGNCHCCPGCHGESQQEADENKPDFPVVLKFPGKRRRSVYDEPWLVLGGSAGVALFHAVFLNTGAARWAMA